MSAAPPGLPGQDNYSMTIDAKARQHQVTGIDLAASGAQLPFVCEFARSGHVVLEAFLRTRATNGANPITVLIGTAADDDAIGTVTIAGSEAAGKKSFTLASTLASKDRQARNRPLVPKGTPLYLKYTGAANCPIADFVISSYPMDESVEN